MVPALLPRSSSNDLLIFRSAALLAANPMLTYFKYAPLRFASCALHNEKFPASLVFEWRHKSTIMGGSARGRFCVGLRCPAVLTHFSTLRASAPSRLNCGPCGSTKAAAQIALAAPHAVPTKLRAGCRMSAAYQPHACKMPKVDKNAVFSVTYPPSARFAVWLRV